MAEMDQNAIFPCTKTNRSQVLTATSNKTVYLRKRTKNRKKNTCSNGDADAGGNEERKHSRSDPTHSKEAQRFHLSTKLFRSLLPLSFAHKSWNRSSEFHPPRLVPVHLLVLTRGAWPGRGLNAKKRETSSQLRAEMRVGVRLGNRARRSRCIAAKVTEDSSNGFCCLHVIRASFASSQERVKRIHCRSHNC